MRTDRVNDRASKAKIVGMMQINSKDYTKYSPKNLFDSEINLKLGAKELRKAMDYGKGHMIKTLAVYHADDLTSQNAKYGQATLDYIENVRKSYSDIQRSEKLYIQENYDLFSKERNIQQ